jgi:hypothetical protein
MNQPLGQIIIVNTNAMVKDQLLSPADRRLVIRGLKEVAATLAPTFKEAELVNGLYAAMKDHANRLQIAGVQCPPSNLHITAFRGWADIQAILEGIQRVEKKSRIVKNALATPKTDATYEAAAQAINQYAATMPSLLLQGMYKSIYYTISAEADDVETKAKTSGKNVAEELRNKLGLVHIKGGTGPAGTPLFAFRSMHPISAFSSGFRIARPTIVDGFSNPRFRQGWPPSDILQQGGGRTVDIELPNFAPGCSEFVATAVPIKDNFECSYVGLVQSARSGDDNLFLDYITGGNIAAIPHLPDSW